MTIPLLLGVLLLGALLLVLWLLQRSHDATVARLEADKRELQQQNAKLIETLAPALRRFDKPETKTVEDILKAKHSIQRADGSAKCSCGWRVQCEDPVKLQAEVSAHWRENNTITKGGRKGWAQGLRTLEAAAEEESLKEMERSK